MSHRREDLRRKVDPGFCTWCGERIHVEPRMVEWAQENLGAPSAAKVRDLPEGAEWPWKRSWHPWCGDAFALRNDPGQTRRLVWKRDHGTCAQAEECGFRKTRLHAYWEADHIVPLKDGGSFELDNLQTLCVIHHRAKTARENSERAARKKASK